MLREIVVIDEELCDGCGLCVPACDEGAIQVVDGKARVISEVLCDGLGACLGHCPRGAINIERREAPAFDESAVAGHLATQDSVRSLTQGQDQQHEPSTIPAGCPSSRFAAFAATAPAPGSGCPGARFATLDRPTSPAAATVDPATPTAKTTASELTHWPVQLHLLSPAAPVLRHAHLLIAADCVPVAYPDFHRSLLRGRAVAIACPKLDDTSPYVDKLTEMFRVNEPAEVTVAHMEVPCCTGILHMVLEARRRSGADVPVVDLIVSRQGEILSRRLVPSMADN
ncbi:MAG: 4Fe-4S binding protein [Phycisphaerae bacterium]|nr:4Fe-4S binding protein [Phycisphaerae bacterium]